MPSGFGARAAALLQTEERLVHAEPNESDDARPHGFDFSRQLSPADGHFRRRELGCGARHARADVGERNAERREPLGLLRA